MKKKERIPKEWPARVEVFEVGPRDGLQSEKKIFSLSERFELVRQLSHTGLRRIEVGSFVRSDRIPQLSATDKLIKSLETLRFEKNEQKPEFWAFIPNEIGFRHALAAKISGASFFVSASETFCLKNVNRNVEDVLSELKILLQAAKRENIPARVYLSTIVYCPYEGVISPLRVLKIVERLLKMGAKEIVLSDTTGHAHPLSLRKLLGVLLEATRATRFALHLHDTRGLALANVLEGMRHGISIFDSSVGGLGGCPYAPGASGNLATEDLVNMLLNMGLLKDVNLNQVGRAALFAEKIVQRKVPSKVLRTLSL